MRALLAELAGSAERLPGHPAALFGRGVAGRLADVLDALGTRRCLVVHGAGSYYRSGAARRVEPAVTGRSVGRVLAEPYQTTLAAVSVATTHTALTDPDTVLGVGGGSALDLAKAIAVLPAGDEASLAGQVRSGRPVTRARRLVLLPTTAGSGSEMTPFATLWQGAEKLSLDSAELRADVVLVDPEFLGSARPPVAVAAAADAFCQAAESYWALAGTDESRDLAAAAFRGLAAAVSAGCAAGALDSAALGDRLARGASLAGAAIAVSRTTAAHALSYALTARLGIPHGAAALLQLPWLVEHNRGASSQDCRLPGGPARLREIVGQLESWCGDAAGTDIGDLSRSLLRLGGYPASHAELRAGRWQDDWLAVTGSARLANNPRLVTQADLRPLLDQPGPVKEGP
ncbi:MAG TPA: iron-containing alcohol dehydrogenase [Streptosporangiaceae bacterium]|nr:iron-containing alcohol dehydrogenase [Streptosporangiaceae bacterium]